MRTPEVSPGTCASLINATPKEHMLPRSHLALIRIYSTVELPRGPLSLSKLVAKLLLLRKRSCYNRVTTHPQIRGVFNRKWAIVCIQEACY